MKRSNGAGSVHKLPGNLRKPWRARVTVGWKEGKQLYKTIGYYETKAKAEEAIALDRVMPVSEHANITLKELFEQWKKTRAYTDISQTMKWNYDAAYKHYMKRYHNTPFRDLRTHHFQDMIDKAAAMGKSHSLMSKIKTLSGILSKYAASQDIIFKSYAGDTRLPKTSRKKKIETFTDLEIQKLFDNDSLPLVDTVLILIYTGMRIRELLTLTKFNVDINKMLITGGIKTDAGKDRIIPIHPKIQKYIKLRYAVSQNYLIEYEKEVGNEKRGDKKTIQSPYRYEYYRDLFYDVMEKLEINAPGEHRITPHKARHTFSTMLSKCNDRKAKAMLVGHTDPNFTEKTYDHPDIERLRKAIEAI